MNILDQITLHSTDSFVAAMNRDINTTETNGGDPTLFLIGIDDSLTHLLTSMRIRTETYRTPEEFLSQRNLNRVGCVICDVVFTGGMSGFELLAATRERMLDLPVIMVSSVADMSLALRAVAEGAVTLLSTSCDAQLAWDAVNRGLQLNRERRIRGIAQRRILSLIGKLSERETQVLRLIAEGQANKNIAAEMNVSLRSVEKWRKDGLEKLSIDSPLQLLRMLMQAGFQDWPEPDR